MCQRISFLAIIMSAIVVVSCNQNKSDSTPEATKKIGPSVSKQNIKDYISQPAPPYGISLDYNADLISESQLMRYLKFEIKFGRDINGEVRSYDPSHLLVTPFVRKESNLSKFAQQDELLSIGCFPKDLKSYADNKKVVHLNLTHELPDELAEKFKDLYDPSNNQSLETSTEELTQIALKRLDVLKTSNYKADTIVICSPWEKNFLDRINTNLSANTIVLISAQIKPGLPKFGTKAAKGTSEVDYNFKLNTHKLVLIGESSIEVKNIETNKNGMESIFYAVQLKFDMIEGDGVLKVISQGADAATFDKNIINPDTK